MYFNFEKYFKYYKKRQITKIKMKLIVKLKQVSYIKKTHLSVTVHKILHQ